MRGLCQVAERKPISKISVAGKAVGKAVLEGEREKTSRNDEKDQTPETEPSERAPSADQFVPVW